MNTEPKRELHLFFATENDTAVILRRGARALWQLIGWDRSADVFEPGQWIKRQVVPESCAVSPDGRHFFYSVHSGRDLVELGDVYTVVSQAPYFTARALFPHHVNWPGTGGRFFDNRHYYVGTAQENRCPPVPELSQVVKGKVTKECRTGLRLLNGTPAPLTRAQRDELLDGTPLPQLHLADRYDTQGGRLYRRRGMDLELIVDFGPPVFEPVVAPYGSSRQADGTGDGWHPLDGDRP